MFDTNIFDKIVDGELDIELLRDNGIKVMVTHVQADEIKKIPDRKKERRERLLDCITIAKEMPTESFCIGYSAIGKAKIARDVPEGELNIRKEIRKGNLAHIEDALIAETAHYNNLTLITNDGDLYKKYVRHNPDCLMFEEFLRSLESVRR